MGGCQINNDGIVNNLLADPIPDNPLIRGKKEIRRGRYNIIVEAGKDRVFKIVTHPNEFFFLAAEDRPKGPHFPIVYAYHGVIGRSIMGFPMHLFEMEKLYPLVECSQTEQLAKRLTEVYWETAQRWGELWYKFGSIILRHMVEFTYPPFESPLNDALEMLARFVERYRLTLDILSRESIMARKDGTLVFADPIRKKE